jgi:glycosyltransferase involved in cell wall biosynthesis
VEVAGLLDNLRQQTLMPLELILVDGASPGEDATREVIEAFPPDALLFQLKYIRHGGGTAIQRNVGIDAATGDFVAFIDDDIRLEPDFFEQIIAAFEQDIERRVGGVAGYIENQHFDPDTTARWRWSKRLRLYTTYEPGRYDYQTGYPINRYMQPPHETLREIDFMGSGCVLWRKEVLEEGLRFSEFFVGFGILEDAHFALRAGQKWKLLENGRARCIHLKAQAGRENPRLTAAKTAINYRFVFVDIVPDRTWGQELRFWRVQLFDLLRFLSAALRTRDKDRWLAVLGKVEGIIAAMHINNRSIEGLKAVARLHARQYSETLHA